jgi:prepilin-type N-terminal cleavage/methylation domain-containing protein
MKSTKGFTLIELLVVIAIIGILSSVVLASLNSARSKGADAATKSNLSNIRSQAEIFYDNGSTYLGVCADATVANMLTSAKSSAGAGAAITAGGLCNASATAWVATAPLKNPAAANGSWCVDSTGASKEVAPGATSTVDFGC